MKNVAIVIGHYPFEKGAISKHFNMTEFEFWSNLVAVSGLAKDYEIFTHEILSGYPARQRAMGAKTKDYDLVIELHFNASNGVGNGVEAVYNTKNERMKKLAVKFMESICENTGIKKRYPLGRDIMDSNQRGTGFLRYTKGDSIILEPFFGDNKSDCLKFEKLGAKGFKTIIDELVDYYFSWV